MAYRTRRPSRVTLGDDGKTGKKGIISVVLNTQNLKVPAAANTTAISAAVTGNASTAVVTALNYDMGVPRSVTVTAGGTSASIAATAVVVTGLNSEGKVISESITPTATTAGTYSGSVIFKTITGFTVPIQGGAGATFSLGTGLKFGIGQRNLSVTQIKLLKTVVSTGVQSIVNAGSTNFDSTYVENNYVTLDATPAGTARYRVFAFNYNWHLNPVNDNPVYGV